MDYTEYIKPELLILIPVLYLIGIAIKKSALADKFIPVVLGAVAVVLAGLYIFATTDISAGNFNSRISCEMRRRRSLVRRVSCGFQLTHLLRDATHQAANTSGYV